MGDVNCMVCEKALAKKKFLFKCRACKREFEDIPGVLGHFLDQSWDKLSCESLEPIVSIKEESEAFAPEVGSAPDATVIANPDQDVDEVKEIKQGTSSSGELTDPVAIAKLEEVKALLERDWYAHLNEDWAGSEEEDDEDDDDDDEDDSEYWTSDDEDQDNSKRKKRRTGDSEGRIMCDLCGNHVKKGSMMSHKARKHGQGTLYECEHCDYKTHYGTSFKLHMKRKHDVGSDDMLKFCLVCGFDCLTKAQVQSHVLKIHGQEELDRWNNYDWSQHDPDTHVFTMPKPERKLQWQVSRCEECNEEFQSARALKKHRQRHMEQCETCGMNVKPGRMKKHIDQEHTMTQCKPCQKLFDSARSYKDHVRKYHFIGPKDEIKPNEVDNTTLKCYTCHNVFENSVEFDGHCNTKESCKYCLQAITHERVHEHMVSLHKASMKIGPNTVEVTIEGRKAFYQCTACPQKFERMKNLKRHFWVTHDELAMFTVEEGENFTKERYFRPNLEEEKVICDICGISIKKRDIRAHKARKHGQGKVFQCELCGFKTHYGNNMPMHMKRKHGLGGNADIRLCLVCGFECLTNAEIKSHVLKIHGQDELDRWTNYDWSKHDPEKHVFTMPKPPKIERLPRMAVYKCDICAGKVFKTCKSWRRHMKDFHIDRTDYSCPFCDLTTKYKSHLRKHLNKKHPSQQFQVFSQQCQLCRKAFETSKGLIIHMKGAHGVMNVKNGPDGIQLEQPPAPPQMPSQPPTQLAPAHGLV